MYELLSQYASEFISALLAFLASILYFRVTSRHPDVTYYVVGPWRLPVKDKFVWTAVIVIGNQGRATARRVRLVVPAAAMEQYQIQASWQYEESNEPDQKKSFTFDVLPPKSQIIVSLLGGYLLRPDYVGHQDGNARHVPMQMQRVFPTWFNAVAATLLLLGAYSAVVLVVRLIVYLAN
jgi:hypothetical protein